MHQAPRTMRLRLVDCGFFILFFLLAVAIQWPATWLAPWIDQASAGHWRLAAATGPLWDGNGILLVRAADNAPWRNAQSIRWQLQWRELWRGRINIATTLEQGALRIVATPGGISVEQLDVTLPAAEIAPQLPGALGRYGWTGSLNARSTDFQCGWNGHACHGEIELLWNDAAVSEIPGPALGDYRLRLVGEGQALHVDLATQRGRLQIAGKGEISGNGVSFNGEASATGSDSASLNALLATLGRPAGMPGKYLIEYREAGTAR